MGRLSKEEQEGDGGGGGIFKEVYVTNNIQIHVLYFIFFLRRLKIIYFRLSFAIDFLLNARWSRATLTSTWISVSPASNKRNHQYATVGLTAYEGARRCCTVLPCATHDTI